MLFRSSFRLSTGTQIRIEPGTLVDSKGNIVHGEVEFRVREFHQTDDLFRSGIPMDTRANGTDRLQTGGMIEMRAFSGKESLNVAPGKTLEVGLAGFRDSKEYDLWYMDEDADWNKRGQYTSDSNRIKIQMVSALTDSLNRMKAPVETDRRIFELVSNLEQAPYLKAFKGIKWRLDESQPIEFLEEQSRIHWEGVRITRVNKKNNLYKLSFTQFEKDDPEASKGIQKTVLARAMSSRADMKSRSAEYEKELAEFERKQNERREQLARAKREADLIQTFRADRLGIWNVDRLMKMEGCAPVYVHFDFENEGIDMKSNIRLFALYDQENSIMEVSREKWNQVYLQKGKAMRLIALLPTDQLALVDNSAIQQCMEAGLKEVTFQTRKIKTKDFLKK